MNIKEEIKKDVFKILKDVDIDSIIIEKPKDKTKGDYAIPCFTFSKVLRKSPIEIANYIKDNLDQKKYEKVEVVNGYLNIFVQKKVIVSYILNKIMTELNNYGSNNIGDSKNIVIEYSSPNIAKPFGIGHLRSTVIGEALKNIYEKNGYNVYSLDFLGDYGTQFGKVLYAYITWGDEEKVKQNPTKELKDLYVKFHEEAKLNPELDEQGRIWFRKLENNDPEALKLWNWFKEESLKDFKKTYKILGISDFDEYNGEAYYKEKAYDVIEMLKKKNLLEVSEGANVVNIGDDIVPALIQKSDGTSIYITRDLAAYIDRLEKYKFDFDKSIDKNVKKRYSSILNPITLIINGFKKIFDSSVLKKILLIGFFISAMFIMYSVSSICATLNVKDTDFIKYNSNYLQIRKPNMTLEEYLTLEQNENINYILPGSSLVSFKFNPREYYQTNEITLSVNGSLSSTDMISNENIISGAMPENEKQIILDKMIIQRQIDQEYGYFKMIGILKPEDMIGKQLTLDNIGDFTVVGIVDLSTPSIYVNPTMLINIIQNAYDSSETEMIGGIYIRDEREPETEPILDYKLYEDKITLKKGRFPENDYEVIVNISHKYDMRLNKTISTMVNDTKLTVVGYYESQEGIDKYLVNNNTVKYKLIREKQ